MSEEEIAVESVDVDAPVENEVVEAEPVEEPVPEETPETIDEPPKKRGHGFQERINAVTRQKYEAQREADSLRAQLDAMQPAAPEVSPPPTLEQFNYDENAYYQAVQTHNQDAITAQVQQTMQQQQQKAQVQRQQQEQDIQQQTMVNTFQASEAEMRGNTPDYDQVVQNPALRQMVQARPDITQAVVTSEFGPEISYHLGKNPAKAAQLMNLDAFSAAREIGKLEMIFAAPKQTTSSSAPAPVKTVGKNSSAVKDPSSMTPEEYVNWYQTK